MKLNENIRAMRSQRGMTLEEVGKKISVSKQTIQRYETGQIPNIPYDKIVALANIFNCSPAYLMGWEENLTIENADFIPDILSDATFIEHIKKLKLLSKEHQNTIFDTIDYWYAKEGN